MGEHAGDVVPPRVSADRAAGFIVAVTLGPGVEQVADLPRRVAGAATVHFEDEREEARPGRGADRGRGRQMAVEAVALAAGRRVISIGKSFSGADLYPHFHFQITVEPPRLIFFLSKGRKKVNTGSQRAALARRSHMRKCGSLT